MIFKGQILTKSMQMTKMAEEFCQLFWWYWKSLIMIWQRRVTARSQILERQLYQALYTVYWYSLVVPPLVWRELVPPSMVFGGGVSKVELCLDHLYDYFAWLCTPGIWIHHAVIILVNSSARSICFRPFQILFLFLVLFFPENLPSLQETLSYRNNRNFTVDEFSDLLNCFSWVLRSIRLCQMGPETCWVMSNEKKSYSFTAFFSHFTLQFETNQNIKKLVFSWWKAKNLPSLGRKQK